MMGAGLATFILLGIIGFIGNNLPTKKLSPEEETAAKKEQVEEWYKDKSHQSCEDGLKKDLRNPETYRRDGEIGILKDSGKEKTIIWKYRAENGFGGMNVSVVTCNIKNDGVGRYEIVPIGS